MLSNAATGFILELYKDYNIEIIKVKREPVGRLEQAKTVSEVLVTNYDK